MEIFPVITWDYCSEVTQVKFTKYTGVRARKFVRCAIIQLLINAYFVQDMHSIKSHYTPKFPFQKIILLVDIRIKVKSQCGITRKKLVMRRYMSMNRGQNNIRIR